MGNGRVIFRVVVGGYLAYLGFQLTTDAMKEKPDNYMMFFLVGIMFLLLGGFWIVRSIRGHLKEQKEESMQSQSEEADEIEAATNIEEIEKVREIEEIEELEESDKKE